MRASELRGTSSLPYFFTKCENQECAPLGEGRGAAAPLLSVKLTAFCIDLGAVGQAGRRKATGGSPQSHHPRYLSGARPPLQTLVFNPSACGSQRERRSEDSSRVPAATQDSVSKQGLDGDRQALRVGRQAVKGNI